MSIRVKESGWDINQNNNMKYIIKETDQNK